MFNGFRSLSANFTPTPNQFYDEILGHYPYCVVAVVGILIRSTLGWEDPDTGERRIETELPLSAFIRPELSESSARRGISEAIAAKLIVRTASASSREGARYALCWLDDEAQERAISRARRAAQEPTSRDQKHEKTSREIDTTRGVNLRGVNLTPPYINKINRSLKKKNKEQTLNVGKSVNCVDAKNQGAEDAARPSLFSTSSADPLECHVTALVQELKDWGSERRHRQLLSLCEQHGLSDLPTQALYATRERMTREGKRGPIAKPGAYYARILLKLLEDRQVFVPTAGEDDPDEVRRVVRESLGFSVQSSSGEVGGQND